MKQIINGKIVTPEGVLEGKTLVMGERIEEIADSPRQGIETVDAGGGYVLPGLIDLHIHGYAGKAAVDGTDEAIVGMAEGVLKNGVTAFLPTTLTVSYETLERAFDCARNVQKAQKTDKELAKRTATVLGVHAEGPFVSVKKKGAQNEAYIKAPDFDFVNKHKDIIKLITVAPEVDPDLEFIRRVSSETDVVVSAGHTDADHDLMVKAIDAGVTHATHLFNAMSSFSHRAPGGTGALLFSDKVSCELICDGVHVHPAWFKPVATLKGAKLNLITDCLTACGLPDGRYDIGGQTFDLKGVECRLSDGTIAGSVIKLNKAVYNLWKSGIELHEAVNAASLYPAETLGLGSERGALRVGYVADAVICDGELNVLTVIHG